MQIVGVRGVPSGRPKMEDRRVGRAGLCEDRGRQAYRKMTHAQCEIKVLVHFRVTRQPFWWRGQSLDIEETNRCTDESSSYAICTKSDEAFTMWGAGIGTDLNSEMGAKQTVDLSLYKGVSFYIKKRGGDAKSVKVILGDKNTAPEGDACLDEAGPEQCDPFTKSVLVTNAWKKQTVLFSGLAQGAWGKPVDAFSPDAVYGFQIQVDKGLSFDICLDQIELVE